jgi:hypothetical protein
MFAVEELDTTDLRLCDADAAEGPGKVAIAERERDKFVSRGGVAGCGLGEGLIDWQKGSTF